MITPMEMLAVLALRPEFAAKATEQDAEDLFEVGAEFVPESALSILAHRYPGITFRHAEDVIRVYPNLLRDVARANGELALASKLSPLLERDQIQILLRDNPQRLKFLVPQDRERVVSEQFAEELAQIDPISVLRFAKQFLRRPVLEDLAEKAFLDSAKSQGYDQAYWSTFRLDNASSGTMAGVHPRFFYSVLGQVGQGWISALSIERTNLKESGRLYGQSDFLVQAVQYSFDNVTDSQAEELSRNCVLRWDFTQWTFHIGVLSDWHYSNTHKAGCYIYSRDPSRRSAPAGHHPAGPIRIPKNTTFGLTAMFGTHTARVERSATQSMHDPDRNAPSLRITICGRYE